MSLCIQRFDTIQAALLRRLHNDDLGVVRAVLQLEGLFETISSPSLFFAFYYVRNFIRSCMISVHIRTAISGCASFTNEKNGKLPR